MSDLVISKDGVRLAKCAAVSLCTQVEGLTNHLHWPDGVADGSGVDYENDALLPFLRDHPLP